MTIDVQIADQVTSPPDVQMLQGIGERVLEQLDKAGHEVCVRIVEADESRTLNERYRGKDKPTNVLSFPADLPAETIPLLGDLVICAPVVIEEARQQSKQVDDHYTHMLVHGLLHLGGYDHEEEQQAQQMEALEVALLAEFGVEDPYS